MILHQVQSLPTFCKAQNRGFRDRARRCASGVLAPILAILLIASFAAGQDSTPSSEEDNTLFWHTKLEDAKAEAKATGKPIFLEFRCAP